MTVRELIKRLHSMPHDAKVGISVFDGYGIEAGAWASGVRVVDKADPATIQEAKEMLNDAVVRPLWDAAPEMYVLILT